jgi:hypothetical protein
VLDGEAPVGVEEPELGGEVAADEPVSLDPAALSAVEPAVEVLELSPEPDASASLPVWEETSLPVLPPEDSPSAALAEDAALEDI